MSFEFAEYFTHYAADFAFGRVSFNSSQDERNQVGGFVFMASFFQSVQGFFNLGVVAGSFYFGNLFSLQFANGAINAEQVFGGSSSWVNLLTPTITRRPLSTSICHL